MDVLQNLDRYTNTVATSTTEVTEATNVSVDNSEEDSVLLVSGGDKETLITTKDDDSREDLLDYDQVCFSAGEPNQGLCTYLNLAPNVDTKEDKLQVDELEALGLVEKAQKVFNDHYDPFADRTKAEKDAAEKMNIKYLPKSKQFSDVNSVDR